MFRGGGRFGRKFAFLVSDSWACLVSDSRILVSHSQFLVSDSQFLIHGVLYLIPVF